MLKHGHSTGQPPILKQQLAMGVGMGLSSALVYNESCKICAFVQKTKNVGVKPSNKGTQREA